MTENEFFEALHKSIAPGLVLDNPGGGTSRIAAVSDGNISYVRGNSTIRIHAQDLFFAFQRFRGGRVSSTDLREFSPSVFDSMARPAGHSCNCTFLFLLLGLMGLAGPIEGAGVAGDPFAVELK